MKKKKLKKKVILFIAIFIFVFLIIVINPTRLYYKHQLKKLNYSNLSIETILNNNLKDEIISIKYNETLDHVLSDKKFEIKNFDYYKDISYYELNNYAEVINTLIEKGYDKEDINNILKHANNNNINIIIDNEYIDNISSFLEYDFAKLENINRYINYQKNNNLDKEIVVIYVNIGLDKDYYEDTSLTNSFSYNMLVNKYHGVFDDFSPIDIVEVPDEYGKGEKLNKKTLDNFIKMSLDCKKETGYKLLVRSGYRDFISQEKTYNSYLKSYGKKYTENYVTHVGYSEHHTGLAIDIKAESTDVFANSKESKWAYENAHKYGFILRYKKKYEDITGIKYESWHFRYLGEEIATYIYEHDITFEEYYVRFLDK